MIYLKSIDSLLTKRPIPKHELSLLPEKIQKRIDSILFGFGIDLALESCVRKNILAKF